jgi:hypothetical protein
MKKKFLPLAIAVFILFFSCNKNSSPNPNPNPNPPAGGGNGSLTVTSIVPANPYPDDEFIITGTGFNANAALDTVEFGRLADNTHISIWHDGLSNEWPSLCTVISASATQLKVKAVNPDVLDFYSYDLNYVTSVAAAQIRTGGKTVITPIIPFKRFMLLTGITNLDDNIQYGRPNDSIQINGKGFNKTGLTASIGGTALSSFKRDSVTPVMRRLSLRLPKTFFGTENDETITQLKSVVVTNPDGKSVKKDLDFFVSPKMKVISVSTANSSYSHDGLVNSGGVINITITGVCLKNDAILKIDGNTGFHSQTALSAVNFPDTITMPLGANGLIPGTYNASVWRGGAIYGGCTFKVTQYNV